MKVIQRPIDEIKPYTGNPRQNDDAVEAVAASIREFGFRQPIVVDGDRVIVCGQADRGAAGASDLGWRERESRARRRNPP